MNNSMIHPLISIVVPVYNVEYYLQECLDSLINQTYQNIEIIIVNDESPDNCLQIIEDYARKDARVKYIDQKNTGLSGARNAGVHLSRGDFIMFVDSDDWLDLKTVEILASKMYDFDLVVCSYMRCYNVSFIPRNFDMVGIVSGATFQRRLVGLLDEELRDPGQADTLVTAWGKLYKSVIIKSNNIQFISTKEIGTEDLLFNVQYCNCISKVFIFNIPLYMYRRNNVSSLTSTFKPALFKQWTRLYEKITSLISAKDTSYHIAFKNRTALSIIGLGLNEMQNPKGFRDRIKNLKQILSDPLYDKAYKQLQLKYFPLHWKLFFVFAKYKVVLGVYLMLVGINYFVNKKN